MVAHRVACGGCRHGGGVETGAEAVFRRQHVRAARSASCPGVVRAREGIFPSRPWAMPSRVASGQFQIELGHTIPMD
jgi:hypothetical protein